MGIWGVAVLLLRIDVPCVICPTDEFLFSFNIFLVYHELVHLTL